MRRSKNTVSIKQGFENGKSKKKEKVEVENVNSDQKVKKRRREKTYKRQVVKEHLRNGLSNQWRN